jgi:Na+-driven multidrug efflux pump
VAVVPLSVGRVLAADLKGRGRPELVSLAALGAVAATIVFDLALIPILGLVGAGIASVLTYSVSTIALLVAYRAVTGGRLSALVPRVGDLADAASTLRSMGRAGRDAT